MHPATASCSYRRVKFLKLNFDSRFSLPAYRGERMHSIANRLEFYNKISNDHATNVDEIQADLVLYYLEHHDIIYLDRDCFLEFAEMGLTRNEVKRAVNSLVANGFARLCLETDCVVVRLVEEGGD